MVAISGTTEPAASLAKLDEREALQLRLAIYRDRCRALGRREQNDAVAVT
jgi:hypothetical protein